MFRLGFKGRKYPVRTPLISEYENKWRLIKASEAKTKAIR